MDKDGLWKLNRHPELGFCASYVCAVSYEARILTSLSVAGIDVGLAGRSIAPDPEVS